MENLKAAIENIADQSGCDETEAKAYIVDYYQGFLKHEELVNILLTNDKFLDVLLETQKVLQIDY